MKLFNNKKGQTLFNVFIYYLITLFGISILAYLIVEVSIIGYLMPVLERTVTTNITDPTTATFILARYAKIKFFLRLMPFLLFFGVTVYLFIRLIIKEGEAQEL